MFIAGHISQWRDVTWPGVDDYSITACPEDFFYPPQKFANVNLKKKSYSLKNDIYFFFNPFMVTFNSVD